MITVNMHEAKTHLSELVEKALRGEKIIVCKRNEPLIELTPVAARKKFFTGNSQYTFNISDDAFAPLTEEECKEWYGQ